LDGTEEACPGQSGVILIYTTPELVGEVTEIAPDIVLDLRPGFPELLRSIRLDAAESWNNLLLHPIDD